MRESLKAHLRLGAGPDRPAGLPARNVRPGRRRRGHRPPAPRRLPRDQRAPHARSSRSAALTRTAPRCQAFREGKSDPHLLRGAGGTGFSYHADLSGGNTQRRVHYLLQTGYRSDRALQGMGHAPPEPGIGPALHSVRDRHSGRRCGFISVIARRLEALLAPSRADSAMPPPAASSTPRTTSKRSGARSPSPRCLKTIGQSGFGRPQLRPVARHRRPGTVSTARATPRPRKIPITRFLNRVLCCDLGPAGGVRDSFMDALMEQLEHVIDAAKRGMASSTTASRRFRRSRS